MDVQTETLTPAELAAVRRALWEYRDLLDRKARVPVWPRLKPRPSNAERDEVRAERDLADAALAKLTRTTH